MDILQKTCTVLSGMTLLSILRKEISLGMMVLMVQMVQKQVFPAVISAALDLCVLILCFL
jgi:hypothetical protein